MSPGIHEMEILPLPSTASAADVAQLAERRLRESPYFFLRRIRCRFDAGVLTLEGTVPMRQLRQFAESIVARVEGVRRIDNQVDVHDPVMPIGAPAARSA
jgi:osmotically-inducible protein OsmY